MISVIYDSIISQIKLIVDTLEDDDDIKIDTNIEESIEVIHELDVGSEINDNIARHISILWHNNDIKNVFNNRTNVSIVDSCPNFFNKIVSIGKHNY